MLELQGFRSLAREFFLQELRFTPSGSLIATFPCRHHFVWDKLGGTSWKKKAIKNYAILTDLALENNSFLHDVIL
jgi:hypothetical protein